MSDPFTTVVTADPRYNLAVQEGGGLTLTMLGPAGPAGATGATGAAGPNEVTSATASDGTADLSVSNITINSDGTNLGAFDIASGMFGIQMGSGDLYATLSSSNWYGTTFMGSHIQDVGTTDTPTFGNLTLASGTITTSQPLSLTQTWNAAGVTFKGIDVNVTDIASAAVSTLMDLRVGGVSKVKFYKNGSSFLNDIVFVNENEGRTLFLEGGELAHKRFGTTYWRSNESVPMLLRFSGALGWSSSGAQPLASGDLFLYRDAANTLAQRNNANAQEFRLYGTYSTSPANTYERLTLKATGTAFQIGTEKGSGGGTARPLEFQTDGTTRMTIGATGTLTYSASQTGFFDISKTAQTGTREPILRAKVSDSGDDAFHVYNGTINNNSFAPSFSGSRFSSNLFAIQFVAQTNSSNDTGTAPLMLFESRLTDSQTDPNNGNLSAVSTRPLFAWQNLASEKMRMLANGNLVLGATTAASRLTITGGDTEITDSASGVILKSPDGTRYRITVANGGTLTVTAV